MDKRQTNSCQLPPPLCTSTMGKGRGHLKDNMATGQLDKLAIAVNHKLEHLNCSFLQQLTCICMYITPCHSHFIRMHIRELTLVSEIRTTKIQFLFTLTPQQLSPHSHPHSFLEITGKPAIIYLFGVFWWCHVHVTLNGQC